MKPIARYLLLTFLLCLSATQGASAGAKANFSVHEYDMKQTAKSKGAVRYLFHFTNEGDAPLLIEDVVGSCSCVKVEFSKQPILPGKNGTITVTFNPKKLNTGFFHKTIYVYSNSETPRHVLILTGEVIP